MKIEEDRCASAGPKDWSDLVAQTPRAAVYADAACGGATIGSLLADAL